MNKHEFNRDYNGMTRCHATYKNVDGFTLIGLLLDGVQTSVTGHEFVFIDSFYNRVPLGHIKVVRDTGIQWLKE